MSMTPKVQITMTDYQAIELQPLFDELSSINKARGIEGEYGFIIGQVQKRFTGQMMCAFGVFDYETAKKIAAVVMGEKP